MLASRFAAPGLFLVAWLLAADAPATSRNNGQNGYTRQPTPLLVPVPIGHVLQAVVMQPHSTIRLRNNRRLTDTTVTSLIQTSLVSNGQPKYEKMVLHMAQCYGGGFIDELEDAAVLTNFSINTSSFWEHVSYGQLNAGGNPRNYHSHSWREQVNTPNTPKAMLASYSDSLTAQIYNIAHPDKGNQILRNLERPQFFSRPNAADDHTLTRSADQNVALIFVGEDRERNNPRDTRHFRDAGRMYDTLRAYGFTDAQISFQYVDGTTPAGGNDARIDGAASLLTYLGFISGAGVACGDQNDFVFIWTSGHGGTYADVQGIVQLLPIGAGVGVAEAEYDLPLWGGFLDAAIGPWAPYAGDDPILEMSDFTLAPGDALQVFLNDSFIGSIGDSQPVELPFSPSLLTQTQNRLRFVGTSPQTEIRRFSLHQFTNTAPVDEPSPGDMNCDGAADILDINAFILALIDPFAYAAQFPGCDINNGDLNGDGSVNVLDINPFVALLAGG
ncbi:hypothetical protein RAS1_30300 [Phycisphaerae bacterium RAS1]|nr:hypothetical protein RAS1_30300 [Phycisphaerae bacterium RAS1]